MVGEAVQRAVELGKPLEALSIEELAGGTSDIIDEDVYEVLTLTGSVAARDHLGGTAPHQVLKAIAKARTLI